ncbi:MAG TPA: hypothetical protein VF650_14525 [Allosphingosinicella sp.]
MSRGARPLPVRAAEALGLLAAGLGAVREAFIWEERTALDGPALALVFTLAVPLVMALLVLLVTRRRSKAALVVLFLLAALAWLTTGKLGLTDGSLAFTAGAASLILQSASLLLMLTPPALRWLRPAAHG